MQEVWGFRLLQTLVNYSESRGFFSFLSPFQSIQARGAQLATKGACWLLLRHPSHNFSSGCTGCLIICNMK